MASGHGSQRTIHFHLCCVDQRRLLSCENFTGRVSTRPKSRKRWRCVREHVTCVTEPDDIDSVGRYRNGQVRSLAQTVVGQLLFTRVRPWVSENKRFAKQCTRRCVVCLGRAGLTKAPHTAIVDSRKKTGASKGTPGDSKCVTKVLDRGDKEVRGEHNLTFLFQGKISALNLLNSQINVLKFMSKML